MDLSFTGEEKQIDLPIATACTVCICETVIAFHADYTASQLHVVAKLGTGEIARELRIIMSPECGGEPVLVAPGRTAERTGVEPRPIIRTGYKRCRVLQASTHRLVRGELVAQSCVDADAFDVLTDPVIDTAVAEPAGIKDLESAADSKSAVRVNRAGIKRASYL